MSCVCIRSCAARCSPFINVDDVMKKSEDSSSSSFNNMPKRRTRATSLSRVRRVPLIQVIIQIFPVVVHITFVKLCYCCCNINQAQKRRWRRISSNLNEKNNVSSGSTYTRSCLCAVYYNTVSYCHTTSARILCI